MIYIFIALLNIVTVFHYKKKIVRTNISVKDISSSQLLVVRCDVTAEHSSAREEFKDRTKRFVSVFF